MQCLTSQSLKKPNVIGEFFNKNTVDMQLMRETRFEMQSVSEVLKDWSKVCVDDSNKKLTNKKITGGEMAKEVQVMRKLVYKFNSQWRREKVLAFFRQVLLNNLKFK